MQTRYSTTEIIKSSVENINVLKDHLEKISELKNSIKETLEEVKQVPAHFDKLGLKLSETSDQFIYKNYELLKEQNIFLQEKIIDLNNRIAQIDQIDFRKRFENANSEFFQNLEKVSRDKIDQFDIVKDDLNSITENFKSEVERLQSIDLENHFNKHDKRLSDIFGGVNNINSSLLIISNQTQLFQDKISGLDQKLQIIEKNISENEKNLLTEIKILKDKYELSLQKQNKYFLILATLMAVSILTVVALNFIK